LWIEDCGLRIDLGLRIEDCGLGVTPMDQSSIGQLIREADQLIRNPQSTILNGLASD
jgi:hypothetical protein